MMTNGSRFYSGLNMLQDMLQKAIVQGSYRLFFIPALVDSSRLARSK
jgi:hypothetical protein